MNLPELGLQLMYARLAWGIVLATVLVAVWARRYALSRGAVIGMTLGMIALQALPGAASPAYHVTLAWQMPSCLLVGLCLAKLYGATLGTPQAPLMPPRLAMLIAGFGALLYLDTMGVTAVGPYYWGFGPKAAPLVGLLIAAGSAIALAQGQARAQAGALFFGAMAFALLRLPSGNIWDAMLDPLLWGWSLVALAMAGVRKWRAARSSSRFSA